jgi:FKBP-type peptidyl-prolyl cis-trans isomerase FkpA/FKBP-type peptidyl-prolyl cis-trans isomerase FklB
MKSRLASAALVPLLLTLACSGDGGPSAETAALDTNDQKAAYGIGMNMGTQLQAANERLDRAAFMRGFEDGMTGAESQVPEAEVQAALMEFGSQIEAQANAARAAEGEQNAAAGRAYLEQNRAKPGVTTTASGLQYEVMRAGSGQRPTAASVVRVHYRGTLIDGTEFDSSYGRGEPAEFPLDGVIAGFSEALQLMPVGSQWRIVIPSEIAYGPGGSGPIGPNSTLIFEIELLEIVDAE